MARPTARRGSGLEAKTAAQHSREQQPAPVLIREIDDGANDLAVPEDTDARSNVSWDVTLNHVARLETSDGGPGEIDDVASLAASVRCVVEVDAHAARSARRG